MTWTQAIAKSMWAPQTRTIRMPWDHSFVGCGSWFTNTIIYYTLCVTQKIWWRGQSRDKSMWGPAADPTGIEWLTCHWVIPSMDRILIHHHTLSFYVSIFFFFFFFWSLREDTSDKLSSHDQEINNGPKENIIRSLMKCQHGDPTTDRETQKIGVVLSIS